MSGASGCTGTTERHTAGPEDPAVPKPVRQQREIQNGIRMSNSWLP
jgi:hypothetical protein